MGGNQAGMLGALTLLSKGNDIIAAVSYSDDLTVILKKFRIPLYKSIKDKYFIMGLSQADILLSVHGREVVGPDLLKLPKYGAVNLHPYLYKYKGASPVERALKDGEFNASVGAHIMEEKIDEGRVLYEEFVDVSGSSNADSVYNKIYPSYCNVLLKVLEQIGDEKYKK